MGRVFVPKAAAAWYLHQHTQQDNLALFVVYSSVASLFGNVGQANYSAANASMDELVRWRVANGLAGLSVQWPGVAGVGMAAAMDKSTQINKAMLINADHVKHTLRQLVGTRGLAQPVQAVLPRAMLAEGILPESVTMMISAVQTRSGRVGRRRIRGQKKNQMK